MKAACCWSNSFKELQA